MRRLLLRIMDVSNPAAPVEIGAFYNPTVPFVQANDVEVMGGLAYVPRSP